MDVKSLYGPVRIAGSSVVGEYCVLGYPKEERLRNGQSQAGSAAAGKSVVIGERCLVFNHVVLYEGVQLGDECVVEDRVRVGYDSRVGAGSRLVYGAYVCDRVTIGARARIAGFLCDGVVVGDRSTVMGELVHEYSRPHLDWWEVDEVAPAVEADSVVGFGARVVGGVRIGPFAYVAAGAVVTKDVPPHHVVTGVNVQTPAERWSGRRLQELLASWTGSGAGEG